MQRHDQDDKILAKQAAARPELKISMNLGRIGCHQRQAKEPTWHSRTGRDEQHEHQQSQSVSVIGPTRDKHLNPSARKSTRCTHPGGARDPRTMITTLTQFTPSRIDNLLYVVRTFLHHICVWTNRLHHHPHKAFGMTNDAANLSLQP